MPKRDVHLSRESMAFDAKNVVPIQEIAEPCRSCCCLPDRCERTRYSSPRHDQTLARGWHKRLCSVPRNWVLWGSTTHDLGRPKNDVFSGSQNKCIL